MPANIDMFMDPSFNYGNWIEIYNPGTADVDIGSWYLSNDTLNKRQCPLGFSSRIVKAGGFLVLWMDHYDDYCQDQIEYFDFRYENSSVILYDRNGTAVSRVDYKTIPARTSYARKTDGGQEWSLTSTPTPGDTNSGSVFASKQLEAPVVDVDSRLFTSQFYINITIPDGATLYYTKDGSTPTPDNPNVKISNGSHTVSDTRIYRFRLYKEGMLPSPVTTRSYIRTSNQYGIPVVSVVTDNDNLYSTEYGIWQKGPHGKAGNGQSDLCNWNRDWDRPVNIEVIDANGKMVLNQEAEITPSGRYSRAFEPRPFKVKAKKRYGYDNYFAFTPFPDKAYNKYQSFKMRGGGNNFTARLKDAALQQIIIRSGFNADCQSYQPVHHYINGVYKGVINIREPNNKDFAYSNYGFDDDEVDCFKLDHNNGSGGLTLTEGSRADLDEWVRLSKTAGKEASYKRICQIVDIDEFVNYMAIEFFLANQDWPRNNIKAFKHSTDGRFRFVVFDLDHSFGSVNEATDIEPFTFFDSEEYYSDGKTGYKSAMVTIFHGMLNNDAFRKKFIDAFCIVAGSVFDPDRVRSIVNELATRASREMAFNNESPMADANLITGTITASYRQKRTEQLANWSWAGLKNTAKAFRTVSVNIPQAVLSLNGQVIPTGKLNGYVFMPAKVNAVAPVGYTFSGWQDKSGTIISTQSEFDLSLNVPTVTACFTPNTDINLPVRINEVSAQNDVFINDAFKKHDWIELYNTTQHAINVGGMYLSNNPAQPHKYALPDTTIAAGGYLVLWCDNENGTQLHAPFKLKNDTENAIVLTAADDSWADTLIYKSHTKFQSIGLYPDGGNSSYVMNLPSIGKPNRLSGYDDKDRDWITGIRQMMANASNETTYNVMGIPVNTMEAGKLYIRNGRPFYYHP